MANKTLGNIIFAQHTIDYFYVCVLTVLIECGLAGDGVDSGLGGGQVIDAAVATAAEDGTSIAVNSTTSHARTNGGSVGGVGEGGDDDPKVPGISSDLTLRPNAATVRHSSSSAVKELVERQVRSQ